MHILVLQHLEIEPPGLIADIIRGAGHDLDTIRLWQGEAVPHALDDWGGLIVMGGPQSANDSHLSYIRDEIVLLKQAITRDHPVLGICLGAQLLARAGGADILPSPAHELGWYPVYPTDTATTDPLFRHMQAGQMVFQWHGETFSLPAEAKLLATHPNVPHQAFRIGSCQYGLQFHFEVDQPLIRQWVDAGTSEREHLGDDGVQAMLAAIRAHLQAMHGFCTQAVHAWIDLIDRRQQ